MTLKGKSPREDPVNILGCCGGHEDYIDSYPQLWTKEDFRDLYIDLYGDKDL